MILGLGLDVVELDRIRSSLDRFGTRFEERILTPAEIAGGPQAALARTAYVAARFAVKEAAAKALGTGIAGGVGFQDIAVRRTDSGAPELVLTGGALAAASRLGATRFHVSITHGRDIASAVVILEKD